ncbi:MAG: hypothetical protein CL421_06860 [Acidimicrobiaceae bacterium]|nr:hypothetical protein [Acidimicrobiaceae bacterium]
MSDNELHEMKILTGRKLSGRYVLSSLISLGQFTQIWEATDLVLSRTVAVKLTNQHLVSESIFLSRFRAEARTISRLNHPSIISILDTTGDDQIEAIVMELIEGETLKDFILRTGPLPVEDCLPFINNLVDALSYAHKEEIVHGSLSPEKVFLCPDRGIKISGFGFNESAALLERTIEFRNDPNLSYTSPEQGKGELPNNQSDVFSLGKLLQFILTGSENSSHQEIASFPLNKKIIEAIAKATAGTPSQRYSSVVEFKDDIESAVSDTPDDDSTADSISADRSLNFDSQRIVTNFLWVGMVFFFVLGVVFATNLDDSLFGSDNTSESQESSLPVVNEEVPSTDNSSEAGSTETTATASSDEAASGEIGEASVSPIFEVVSIAGARDYDPLGDGVEHPELIENLLDEDSSTVWYSETYANRSLGFLKDGVGFIVELKKSFPIQSLKIETTKSGWSADIYISETIGTNLADWGTVFTSIDAVPGDITVDLTGATGANILIWFTDLGDDPPPGVRMEISEIEVS